MKKLITLFAAAFLFQSCFSSRSVSQYDQNLQLEKRYRIETAKKTYRDARLKSANDSTLTVLAYNETVELRRSDIKKMKRRKFSVVKTIAYPVGTVAVIVGVFAATYDLE